MDNLPTPLTVQEGSNALSIAAEADIMDRLGKVEAMLLTNDPMMPIHCASILKSLHQYEELVHLMPDEKIRILMQGMQKYRMIELVKEASVSKNKKALSKTTVDDI